MKPVLSVAIPTLNAGPRLGNLVRQIVSQCAPETEILILDSESTDDSLSEAARLGARTLSIRRRDFGHGRTRNLAVRETSGEVVVFLTQDAEIIGSHFLQRLTRPVLGKASAAAFARQVPREGAGPVEAFSRYYSYGPESRVQRLDDVRSLARGVRAFFFSNAASCVEREAFFAVGGFPNDTIMAEDMFLCARLLRAGRAVAYVADAEVRHSHPYTPWQQLKRHFDIGVALCRGKQELGERATAGDGLAFLKAEAAFLRSHGTWRDGMAAVADAFARAVGIHLGYREAIIPRGVKKLLSWHAGFWDTRPSSSG